MTAPSFTGELLGTLAFYGLATLGTVVLLRLRARRHRKPVAPDNVIPFPISNCVPLKRRAE